MTKVIAILSFLTMSFLGGFAQLDTEHYLPPLTSSTHRFIGQAGAGYQVIYLSTPSAAPVNYTIYNGAGVVLYSGTVSNANPVNHGGEGVGEMFGLNTPLFVNQANLNKVLTGRGIRVVADAPIYCNLRVRSPNNAQAASITSKGTNALGTTFRLGHITTPQKASNWGLQSLGSKLATVGFHATEDNTQITVDLSRVNPKLWGPNAPNAAAPFTITLNKGESYVLALRNQDAPNRNAGAGFSGGLVTSTKPIVVNCASMGGYASNTWQADYGADQIVPIERVGTEYAVVRGASNDNALEKVMIVAHENGTEVKVNGQVVCGNLQAGQYCNINGSKYQNGAMFIETSKPSYAYQFIMGHGGGDKKTPGMNFLPPITCETASYVDNIPLVDKIGNRAYKGTINIVTTATGSNLEVFVNGVKRNNLGNARPVPNSNYIYYKISNLTGNLAVRSETIALVSMTGYNDAAGFGGFFSGWKEVTVSDSANCLPGYLFEPIPKPGTYRWFKDGIEIPGETNDSLFATETGIYTFERSNAGCKDTSNDINAVAVNQFSFDGDTAFCLGDSVQLTITGQGFDSLAWETGEQSNSIWLNTHGTTDVRIYSDVTKDCFVDTFVTTVGLASPTVTLLDTSFCEGGSVSLDAGNPGMTYDWSNGETTQTISVSQSGDYIVRVSDGNSACAGLDTASIVVYSCNTDAQVSKTDNRDKYIPGTGTQYTIVAKNNGPNDIFGGVVSDPIPAGVNSGDVSWSGVAHGGATTQSTGIATGALLDSVDIPVGDSVVYTVKLVTPVTFIGDLTNVVTITADRDTFAANDIAIDTDTVDCTFAVSGTVNSRLNAWQQVGPVLSGLTYNFGANTGSRSFIATNGPQNGNPVLTVVYNGVTKHNVSLTRDRYDNGNVYFGTITHYDNTPHSWTGLSGVGAETAPVLGFMAFIDQNGNGQYDSGAEEYIRDLHDLTMTPTTTGELYMAFYDDGYYGDNEGVLTIEASLEKPEVNTGPNDFRICKGDSVAFDAGNPSALRWDWNTGVNQQVIQADSTGQYIVEVVTFGGCSTKDTMNLIVDTVDVVLPADTAFCEGGSWTVDAGAYDSWAWNTGDSTQTIVIDSAGYYEVRVTNAFGCRDSDDVEVSIRPLPVAELRNDTSICPGDSVELDAQNAGSSYLWNNSETTRTISIKSAGSYDVLVTNIFGCEGRDTMILGIHPSPVVDLGPDLAFCDRDSATIDAGAFDSYLWSTNETSQSIQVKTAGEYTVSIIDGNSCPGRDTINVVVHSLPQPILRDTSLCDGNSVTINTGLYAGDFGVSHTWSAGTSAPSVTLVTAGNYYIDVEDANGCVGSDTMNVEVHPNPVIDLGDDTTFCEPNSLMLSPGNWAKYNWNTGEDANSITVNSTGTYNVEIVDNNGCQGFSSVNIWVNPLPIVNLPDDTTLCPGETLNLDAGNTGLNHLWSDGETTQTRNVGEGYYMVEVTDAIGCYGADEITIYKDSILDPYPEKYFEICAGETQVLEPAFGYEQFSISWPGISAEENITVGQSGIYSSLVATEYCSETFDLELLVHARPNIDLEISPDRTVFCFGYETAELTVNSDISNVEYSWNTGDIDPTIEITEEGLYAVTVSNAMCDTTQEIEISEYCPPALYIPNAFTPDGNGINDHFNAKGHNVENYKLQVLDRWGLLIFETTSLDEGWDGTYNGGEAPIDVYVYKAFYSFLEQDGGMEEHAQIGTVTLVR